MALMGQTHTEEEVIQMLPQFFTRVSEYCALTDIPPGRKDRLAVAIIWYLAVIDNLTPDVMAMYEGYVTTLNLKLVEWFKGADLRDSLVYETMTKNRLNKFEWEAIKHVPPEVIIFRN
jgi:hypothetical protein